MRLLLVAVQLAAGALAQMRQEARNPPNGSIPTPEEMADEGEGKGYFPDDGHFTSMGQGFCASQTADGESAGWPAFAQADTTSVEDCADACLWVGAECCGFRWDDSPAAHTGTKKCMVYARTKPTGKAANFFASFKGGDHWYSGERPEQGGAITGVHAGAGKCFKQNAGCLTTAQHSWDEMRGQRTAFESQRKASDPNVDQIKAMRSAVMDQLRSLDATITPKIKSEILDVQGVQTLEKSDVGRILEILKSVELEQQFLLKRPARVLDALMADMPTELQLNNIDGRVDQIAGEVQDVMEALHVKPRKLDPREQQPEAVQMAEPPIGDFSAKQP